MAKIRSMDIATLTASHDEHRAAGLLDSESIEVVLPEVGEIFCGLTPLEELDRVAYQSEPKTKDDSYERILKLILTNGHESTLEHLSFTVFARTNRGVTHEWVRHRIGCSPTQESTRYVNYDPEHERYSDDASFRPQIIYPSALVGKPEEDVRMWLRHKESHIADYMEAVRRGWEAQEARGDLDNDLKADIVMTFNIRSLRHFLRLRSPIGAHRDIQVIAKAVGTRIRERLPLVLDDIRWE
jgi:thymidylate synthase (FAD)